MAFLGHVLGTIDQFPFETYEKFLFVEFPTDNVDLLQNLVSRKKDLYLVLFESEIIKPDNWQTDNYSFFDKVFGWKPIIHERYHRLMIPQNLEKSSRNVSFSDRKLACLIAGNKYNADTRGLYSQRRKIIRWFESNAPEQFSLYGRGWQTGERVNYEGFVEKLIHFRSHHIRPYPSYRGPIGKKRELLANFRFNFCLENACEIDGYITEKIFDSMLAGVVPIYWGAPDILDFIPREAIILFADFDTVGHLYEFIGKMTEQEWARYRRSADDFLNGDNATQFSADNFSDKIIQEMF